MSEPAVIFGGPSPEHDVSVIIGLQVARVLRGHTIYWSKAGDWFSVDPDLEASDFVETPKGATPLRLAANPGGGFVAGKGGLFGGGKDRPLDISAAVNCCHGRPGEDGTLQAALDLAGIRYTGPSVAGAALGMDKLAFGDVVTAAGLPSLPRAALVEGEQPQFEGPYIVKPRFGGSSIGIEVVPDIDTAYALMKSSVHLKAGAIVEPFWAGASDLQVAVRTWPELQLSAIEKPLRTEGSEIWSYADKYRSGEGMAGAERELPAQVPDPVATTIRDAAGKIATLAAVRGVARIDFLFDGDDVFVNEINTIPGSLAKYLWIDPPVSFDQLLQDLLAEAEAHPTAVYSTSGADGTALRSAASIASKLG